MYYHLQFRERLRSPTSAARDFRSRGLHLDLTDAEASLGAAALAKQHKSAAADLVTDCRLAPVELQP